MLNASWNRWVLRARRKDELESTVRTDGGRLFHTSGPPQVSVFRTGSEFSVSRLHDWWHVIKGHLHSRNFDYGVCSILGKLNMPLTPSCDQIVITEWPAICAVAVYTISQSSACSHTTLVEVDLVRKAFDHISYHFSSIISATCRRFSTLTLLAKWQEAVKIYHFSNLQSCLCGVALIRGNWSPPKKKMEWRGH